ncbi:MAG: T9SS type A sorting domain-containing protein [Ferruginibacter sp.]
MAKYVTICIVLLLSTHCLLGQAIAPGGVKGVVKWYAASGSAKDIYFESLQKDGKKLLPVSAGIVKPAELNYNPALFLSAPAQFSINLNQLQNSFSLFTVYQPADTTKEDCIWHFRRNNKTSLVLTTRRAADLESFRYMNFIDIERRNPKVNIYVQQKTDPGLLLSDFEWQLGAKPVSPALPVSSFKGLLPEVIAYNRVLTAKERGQVASYLAIKYGITLTDPEAVYYSSLGEEIWQGTDYPAYHRNIAGIARDDSSALLQKRSGSSNTPGLFTISANSILPNNSFLLWGENGESFMPGKKLTGLPDMMQKKWLVVSNLTQDIVTDLKVDTRQIDVKADAKTVFWLAADSSGKGDFDFENTTFIRMNDLDENGTATFRDIGWVKGSNKKTVVGFIAKQDLLFIEKLYPPVCASNTQGSFELKLTGGVPPYTLSVLSNGYTKIYNDLAASVFPLKVNNIPAGKYLLQVTDNSKRTYSDSFYLNNADAPQPVAVNAAYELGMNNTIEIDASKNMQPGINYTWEGPGNFYSSGAKQLLSKPGVYTLTSSKNGCSNKTDILVTAHPATVFKDITVFPNPSEGDLFARVELQKPASIDVSIYAADGRVISNEHRNGFANYIFKKTIFRNGAYLIVFRSGNFEETRKIIIVK